MLAWCACFMADHTSSALVRDRAERIELKHLKSSRSTPQKIALRARIILHAADGQLPECSYIGHLLAGKPFLSGGYYAKFLERPA